jgi:acyl-[acyl-carrier-protein]-phospholipid O-acyltransferase / long-chain-fatty-acid--[acyl-carrier-protein] ligase
MFRTLMTSRRFAPLFWCQFFSAFNDNFVRNMLAMLILFRFGGENASLKILFAMVVFILPAIPLSALGGEIADSHDKSLIARRLKFAEIFVQMISAAGFALASPALLYLALFGLGVIAALFGPIKYGILPDHLRREELVSGNALVEGATFVAIICGLVFGGLAAAQGRSAASVTAQLLLIALGCYASARAIPATGIGAPGLKVRKNVFASTVAIIREVHADGRQWVGALGVGWFWTVGAVTLSLLPVIIKSHVGGGIDVEVAINLIFAVGIAAGSLAAALLSHGRIELAPAPFLLVAIGALAIDMGLSTQAMPLASHEVPLSEFFLSGAGLRLAIEILLYSAALGLYVVPLFAAVQAWSGVDRRARVIAAVNSISYIGIVSGSLATMILLHLVRLSEPMALLILGIVNIAAAIYFFRRLPANILGFCLSAIWRLLFRLEVVGHENLAFNGAPNIVVVDHVSWLDAPILFSLMEKPPTFVIEPAAGQSWAARLCLRFADARVLDPARPLDLRALVREARSGQEVVLFLDARAAVAGQSMVSFDVAALIAEQSDALVTPVHLAGAERTFLSRIQAAYAGRRLFPKIKATILRPRRLATTPDLRGPARRRAREAALFDRMAELQFLTFDIRRTLHTAFEVSAKARRLSRAAVEDPLSGPMSLRMFRIAVAVLARKIAALSEPGETIGVMLPNANGAAVTFMALQAAGRVPAMLNFTSGAHNLIAACAETRMRLVLTSRAFVQKGKLQSEIDAIEAHARIVYLEDMRASTTVMDKARAALTAGAPLAERQPDDTAVVLFTSGSEGAPKGVALSHANLLANIAQIGTRFDLRLTDICFNPLPMFHAFGLTGGLLLGLTSSMKVFLYPTPLHYREIPRAIVKSRATFLLGADTFLAHYARNADETAFLSLRYVIAGAEAVKAGTRRLYLEKFSLAVLEGYGVTEASPVIAVNAPAFMKSGTVGKLLPFVELRLDPVPGIDDGARLFIRGPNIMLGYYRPENPGLIQAPPSGWYDTGDIVAVDEEGFVAIMGRAKRFAKIAGETVSLAAVEDLVAGLWPDHVAAAVAVPDPRRGERVILATTNPVATRAEVQTWMKAKGAAEFMHPSSVAVLETIPLLGSGKTNYVALAKALSDNEA